MSGRRGDVAVLEAAIALEQRAALAYAAFAEAGALGPVAEHLSRQEQEHADGLIAALRGLGGSPPPRPEGAGDVPGLNEALRSGGAAAFALELEAGAVATYHRALGQLTTPDLLLTVAGIMASEAQHLVVLRSALGRDPAPAPFVDGGLQ